MARKAVKPHVCLVCWNSDLAQLHAKELAAEGFRVHVVDRTMSGWISYFRDLALDCVVIDLDRLPSHGREVGTVLRGSKSTRHLPLVYLGGLPEKVDRLRHEVADATYAAWSNAASAIHSAIEHPVVKRVRPTQMMERSRDTDLARRLGVVESVHVVAWGDVDFLRELLGDMPDGVDFSTRTRSANPEASQLWLCAVRTRKDVECAFDAMTGTSAVKASGWIVHPEQTSRFHADFNQNDVRDVGLARGWIDCKVCAVDKDWSGLKFARRKADQALRPRMIRSLAAR